MFADTVKLEQDLTFKKNINNKIEPDDFSESREIEEEEAYSNNDNDY